MKKSVSPTSYPPSQLLWPGTGAPIQLQTLTLQVPWGDPARALMGLTNLVLILSTWTGVPRRRSRSLAFFLCLMNTMSTIIKRKMCCPPNTFQT